MSHTERRMEPTPFVSCVMPTRNRRTFVGQSISYFLRQDYPRRERIILDDGSVSIADLIPDDQRIRYLCLYSPVPPGARRDLGCEKSSSELIAHGDDADWMDTDRLTVCVTFQAHNLTDGGHHCWTVMGCGIS